MGGVIRAVLERDAQAVLGGSPDGSSGWLPRAGRTQCVVPSGYCNAAGTSPPPDKPQASPERVRPAPYASRMLRLPRRLPEGLDRQQLLLSLARSDWND